MTKTLEEIVNHPELLDGTEVNVRFKDTLFEAKVIGKSSTGLIPYYIIECTDGTFPNEIYNYKALSIPLSEIFLK